MRVCCRCKVSKPFWDFYLASDKKSGRRSECRVCHNIERNLRNQASVGKVKHESVE